MTFRRHGAHSNRRWRFEQRDVPAYRTRTLADLAGVVYRLGQREAAIDYYRRALTGFEVLGDLVEQANLHYNLALLIADGAERQALLRRGLELARGSGALVAEGNLLHVWADELFGAGDLAAAMEKIAEAIGRLEAAGPQARGRLALALTSLGRLHRAHGHHDRALDVYRRALAIQEAVDDRLGTIQSLNAIAVAHGYLGHRRNERDYFERAYALVTAMAQVAVGDGNGVQALECAESVVDGLLDGERRGHVERTVVVAVRHKPGWERERRRPLAASSRRLASAEIFSIAAARSPAPDDWSGQDIKADCLPQRGRRSPWPARGRGAGAPAAPLHLRSAGPGVVQVGLFDQVAEHFEASEHRR